MRTKAPVPNQQIDDLEEQDALLRQPLLFVDVNLGPARSERIIVRDGDTSEALAIHFCDKNGIKDPVMKK